VHFLLFLLNLLLCLLFVSLFVCLLFVCLFVCLFDCGVCVCGSVMFQLYYSITHDGIYRQFFEIQNFITFTTCSFCRTLAPSGRLA